MAAPAQPAQPKLVSNEFQDFEQGGLFPGGTGNVQFRYVLWDYAGTMAPNSVVAVKMDFQPTDGSNEGKPLTEYFSCGSAKDFAPSTDGGKFLWAISGAAHQIRNNTNWHFFGEKLTKNCGLMAGWGNTPAGIAALDGTVMTLSRIDAPPRDNADGEAMPQMGAPTGKKRYKPTILIPTRAIFPWDKNRGGAPPVVQAPAPVAQAPAPVAAPMAPVAPVPVAAPPAPAAPVAQTPTVPSAPGDWRGTLTATLESLLGASATSSLVIPSSMKLIIETMGTSITAKDRVDTIAAIKVGTVITEIAAAKGWTFDAATGTLSLY